MDLDTLLATTSDVDADPVVLQRVSASLQGASPLRRRRARSLALVAAAAAAVVAVPVVGLGGHRPAASADAAQVLLAAGRAAGAQQGDWQSAAYWHSVSRYSQGGPVQTRETWIGHRAPGVLKDSGVQPGSVVPLEVALFPAGGSGITWDGLWDLPTEPGALERRLREGIDGAGPDDDSELFTIVGDLLRESPAPPALRRALWEVAARVPGVELVGAVTDGAGRSGTAVERHGQRYVLDPQTGRLLEESEASWRATYLEQGPADSAPAATWVSPKG